MIKNPETIFEQTVERMQSLGTYRSEFDVEIKIYSNLIEQFAIALEDWRNYGDEQIAVKNSGRVSQSPYIRTMEALRKDIITYSDRLGLNPKALKGMEIKPDDTGKSLVDVLDRIASGL